MTYDLPEWNLEMARPLMMENNFPNLFWNPYKIVGIMVQTKIWPSSMTLKLGLPEQMFQMAHLHMMKKKNVSNYFVIHSQM